MKKLLLTMAAVLFSAQACFAALSPLNQSIVEFRTIINSPELSQLLTQNEVILGIERIEQGYVIITNQSEMLVEVSFQPSERPGPKEFKLHFNKPRPMNWGQGPGGPGGQGPGIGAPQGQPSQGGFMGGPQGGQGMMGGSNYPTGNTPSQSNHH